MNCAACGAPRTLADRICRSCRLCWETGSKVDVMPPRAAPGRARPLGPPSALARLVLRLRAGTDRIPNIGRYQLALAGLVPGLGHALGGAPKRGALYASGVVGLLLLGAWLFSGFMGQTLFGLAVALHAYSIFDLSPWRDDERASARVGAILGIQAALGILYWPLFSALANAKVASIRVDRDNALSPGSFTVIAAIGFALVAAVAFRLLAAHVGPRLSRER